MNKEENNTLEKERKTPSYVLYVSHLFSGRNPYGGMIGPDFYPEHKAFYISN